MATVADKLEALRLAYEAKGQRVSGSLLEGLSPEELRKRTGWFPYDLTAEIYQLYEWRNGQAHDPWDEEFPFWFRDMGFTSAERAEEEYCRIMDSYGAEGDPEMIGLDLSYCFPFASFNGGWYVLACGPQSLRPDLKAPVISVFQGIDAFFNSVPAMLDTCIEWVSHPEYESGASDLGAELEMEIWKKNNPGLFS